MPPLTFDCGAVAVSAATTGSAQRDATRTDAERSDSYDSGATTR
jgi:hypothetical protein